jgi:hypothetical protein
MPVFQRSAVDNAGNVMPLASVEVRDQVTSGLVQLYSDYALSSTIGNPILADNEGFFRFYVAAGRYRIVASLGGESRTWEDEVLGIDWSAAEGHGRTAAEIAASLTPTNYQYLPGHLYRWGTNTTPGTTDMTTALNNCYAACKNSAWRVPMIIPAQTQKFTSKLTWDGSVDVIGESFEFSKLDKVGNFDGIEIDGLAAAAAQTRYENFTVNSSSGADTAGKGIIVKGSHNKFERVASTGHGSHGWSLEGGSDTGLFNSYFNIISSSNGGDGVNVNAFHFHAFFNGVDARGNTGVGFRMAAVSAYHVGHITCQQNTGGGAIIAGSTNALWIYAEANTGVDVTLTVDSVNNFIGLQHVDTQADFVDLGTGNHGPAITAAGVAYFAATFGRPKRMTNVVGVDVSFSGGHAGAGATARQGGAALVAGGNADGTSGDANGGTVELRGGNGVNAGIEGNLIIQQGTGLSVVGASSPPAVSAKFAIVSTTKGFLPPKMTTTQRDAISSPTSGLLIYNTTTGKLNVHGASGWEAITST